MKRNLLYIVLCTLVLSLASYDKDVLKKLVPETVKAWASNADAEGLTVLLSAKDLKALESSLKTALKSQISKGLEIKADASLSSGFRIGTKDGSAFYDFSAEEVAGLFSSYLNPKTTELMKRAAAGLPHEEPAATKTSEEKDAEPAVKKTTRRTKKAAADVESKETK